MAHTVLQNAGTMTPEQMLDYLRCMTVSKGAAPDVYRKLKKNSMTPLTDIWTTPPPQRGFAGKGNRTNPGKQHPGKDTVRVRR